MMLRVELKKKNVLVLDRLNISEFNYNSVKFIALKCPLLVTMNADLLSSKKITVSLLTNSNLLKFKNRYIITELLLEGYFVNTSSSLKLSKNKSLIISVHTKKLKNFLIFLKYHWRFRFNLLMDLWAVDYASRIDRFEVSYNLLSLKNSSRIYVKTFCNEWSGIPSLHNVFPSTNWLEREVWDLFGVFFWGHTDLRRILTDYGFIGYPLRKEFPLSGYTEYRYDDTVRRVVTEGLNLIQELRLFFFVVPWKKL